MAFGMAEDCDVPQLFFSRYSSPAQLLLKDPEKPFRSDNINPPLKLDFRIKNAVLIVAGENAFHLDKGRMDKVRETSAVKFIEAKSLQEGKDKINKGYRRKNYQLAEGLTLKDELSVDSIKEDAFRLFYNYTLKSPNVGSLHYPVAFPTASQSSHRVLSLFYAHHAGTLKEKLICRLAGRQLSPLSWHIQK